MNIVHLENYAVLRAKAYPPITELIEALYDQHNGDNAKIIVYMAKVAAVIAKYPAPP